MKLYQNLNVTGSLTLTGSLNTIGTITATTLVVQTITSSISAITGSTKFGELSTNTHQFTGSVNITGSSHSIIGNTTITSGPGSTLLLVKTSNNIPAITFTGATYSAAIDGGDYLGFSTSGSYKLYINASGSVGIGTSSPARTLHLNSASDTRLAITDNTIGIASTNGTYYRQNGVNAYIVNQENGTFQLGTNNSYFLTALANGNVGIGTGSPSYLLDIVSTTGTTTKMRISATYNGGGLGLIHLTSDGSEGGTITFEKSSGTAQKYKLGCSNTNQLFVYNETAGNQPFTITSSGKVLIGTTTDNSFNFVASPNGHSFLGNTMQIAANDYGGTERQGAFGVAEWANVSSATIDLATIFPRITFTSRTLSVLLQIANATTTTTMCSCLVLFGRTIGGTWSNTTIANININGLALSSASASGTTITLNFGTATFGSAMITILNRA